MAREAQAPVGSRWRNSNDKKGRTFFVLERKGFGKLELMQEGRAYFASITQKDLLDQFIRLPGTAELPSGFGSVVA